MHSTSSKAGKMTRREFAKGSGAAGVRIGAGGAALLEPAHPMPQQPSKGKTIREPARDTPVCREADVGVVGGGPGGVGAAVAAARAGANTVFLERYGHWGGMGTGGLVTILPNMRDIDGKQQIAGPCKEWVDRLDARQAADCPKREHRSSPDKKPVSYNPNRSFFDVRMDRVIWQRTHRRRDIEMHTECYAAGSRSKDLSPRLGHPAHCEGKRSSRRFSHD